MQLYAEYIKEREGMSLYFIDHGFISYLLADNYLYIADMYVKPDYRRKGVGQELLNHVTDIAKKDKKKYILAQVDTSTNGFNASIDGMLKNNFEFYSSNEDVMHFRKVL